MMNSGDEDATDVVNLSLVLHADSEFDPERTEQLVRRLRRELTGLGAISVTLAPTGVAPNGAKGTDPVTWGDLVVAFSAVGGVFTTLIVTLRNWLDRQSGRHRVSVTIDGDTIELERASAKQQRDLLDAFVRRHSGE